MSWARLDDNIGHHPKILRAGPEAAFFWVLCLTYSQRFLTDGHVPDAALGSIGSWSAARARQLATKLTQVRLLERCFNGYQVHDFLCFNPSAAVARERRAARSRARRIAGRKGGLASAVARRRHTQITQQTLTLPAMASEAKPKQTVPPVAAPGLEANPKQRRDPVAAGLPQQIEPPSDPIRTDQDQNQDQDQRRCRAASFPQPVENAHVLEKLAHVTLDHVQSGQIAEADTTEDLKRAAAHAGLRYDGERIRKALDSAMVQRRIRPPMRAPGEPSC